MNTITRRKGIVTLMIMILSPLLLNFNITAATSSDIIWISYGTKI